MKKTWLIGAAVISFSMAISACHMNKTDEESLSSGIHPSSEIQETEAAKQTSAAPTQDSFDNRMIPEDIAGTWRLDAEKTEMNLKEHASLSEMFGTGLGTYGSSMEIGEDGSFSYFIGIGIGGSGRWEAAGEGCRISVVPFQDTGDQEEVLYLRASFEQETVYLVLQYDQEDLYWQLDTEGPCLSLGDDGSYETVRDLSDGFYHWASVITGGNPIKDDHGHDTIDYNTQKRSFVCLDDGKSLEVRRWDNLCGSAGEYLIYEYDGITHISRNDDLYHPVLSLKDSSFGTMAAVPDGYMIAGSRLSADGRQYTITFYDKDFQPIKVTEGFRSMENGSFYQNGLMAVRDMETGLMGFMDQKGVLAIPCQYGYVSDFSNGYASVLTGARLIPYTEDSGTVPMFDAEGGQWGIIDVHGSFVVEASECYANLESENPAEDWYCGTRRFSPVRKDKTVDFLASDENDRVLKTLQIP